MLGQIVHAHTEVTRALVNNECTGLERSNRCRVVVVEIFECHIVTQQTVEITMQQQQFTQRCIFALGCSQCIGIRRLGSRLSGFPLGNLLTHFDKLLLRHAGFGSVFGDNRQAQFLQFLLLEVRCILSSLLFVGCDHIGLQRSCRNRLFLNRHSSDRRIYIGQVNHSVSR